MDYITIQQAAEKWKVSQRLVQRYCADGRVAGADKMGGIWIIPATASKPRDPRRHAAPEEPPAKSVPMPLMNTSFLPGQGRQAVWTIPEGAQRDIAWAEYFYFSGQAEKAVQKSSPYMVCPDLALRLSACLIYAYANLSIGQTHRTRFALSELERLQNKARASRSSYLQALQATFAAAGAVLLHLPPPENLPPAKHLLSLLPPGLRIFALYVQAHQAYLQGAYQNSLGIVEATLAMQAEQYPIPAIYLHLVAVMDYMSLRQPELAREHLLDAWKLAQPDDLIEPFGEHHGLLGGTLEAVLQKDWPDDFQRIISLTYRFSAGWRQIHNPDSGHEVADNLTTTEFAAAMLAARGWTDQEIGKHMNFSANTAKRMISLVMDKLNITRRQDLKKYMLK